MYHRLHTLAERQRTNRLHRHTKPTPALPTGIVADLWPPANTVDTRRNPPHLDPRFRTISDLGRRVAAALWPTRLDHRPGRILRGLARLIWNVAALGLLAVSIAVGLTVITLRPILWVLANAHGYLLVRAGWTPPLTNHRLNILADPEQALFDEDHEHQTPPWSTSSTPTPSTAAEVEEWDDPVTRTERRLDAEEARAERQTAALEALAHQPQTAAPAPAPVYYPEPMAQPTVRQRRPLTFGGLILRILVLSSLACGLTLTAIALVATALSVNGTIDAPPTNDELIENIEANTERRVEEIHQRTTTTPVATGVGG